MEKINIHCRRMTSSGPVWSISIQLVRCNHNLKHVTKIIVIKCRRSVCSLIYLAGSVVCNYLQLSYFCILVVHLLHSSYTRSCMAPFIHVVVNVIGRVSYIRIYLLFLFPVKNGKLSTGVIATFNASCYG